VHDHKTVGSIDLMMTEAVCQAENLIQIKKALKNPELFLQLTDSIDEQIEKSVDEVTD
jgi:hypothetical protein